jgi:hypothetical protein
MKNLYLNTLEYDLTVEDFNLKLTSTLTEYVGQKIENTLSTFNGEWFLNFELGIPYYSRILIKNADLSDVNNILLTAIAGINEVQEILEFDTTFDGTERKYTVEFKVVASDGIEEETIEGTVPVGGR